MMAGMIWLDWLAYLALLLVIVAGLIINLIGLPGLWLVVAAVIGYAWLTGWAYVGWKILAALVVMGIVAEVVELLAGSAGARAAGASKRGAVGAIIGALVGGVVGSAVLFLIGTIIGAVVGAFVGAAIIEVVLGKSLEQSARIGFGAAKGRVWGMAAKTGVGVAMLILAMIVGFPGRGRAAGPIRALPPTTVPVPATTQRA